MQCIEVNGRAHAWLDVDGMAGSRSIADAYAELSKVVRVKVSHVVSPSFLKPHMAPSALTTNARLMPRMKKER